jgi:hypothetical protein
VPRAALSWVGTMRAWWSRWCLLELSLVR